MPRTALLAVLLLAAVAAPAAEWERALAPRAWSFPADHGAHPSFRTEWWYLTANLADDDGNRLGAQLTFFRHGVPAAPAPHAPGESAWRLREVHFAHFAVADARAGVFRAFEQVTRPALGRAGAEPGWMFVWNGAWFARLWRDRPLGTTWHAQAEDVALTLVAEEAKPLVLQGDRGLSRKSAEPGNASHYYSFPRLRAAGTLRMGGSERRVAGEAWLDREFSTSALAPGQRGWDWFCIQLDNGEELMVYRMRSASGGSDPVSEATLIAADGSTQRWPWGSFQIEARGSWNSPRTRATYPSGWSLRIPEAGYDLEITPLLRDQELVLSGLGGLAYWEGACSIAGTRRGKAVRGWGYTELTGYAGDLTRAMR